MNPNIELKFRDNFRSFYANDFQNWFEKIAKTLHGNDCFLSIRITSGDGGIDGFVLKEDMVYQLYAPKNDNDSTTAKKIKDDFNKAKSTLNGNIKKWTFVYKHYDDKIGKKTAEVISNLKHENPEIDISVFGMDGLWKILLNKISESELENLFDVQKQLNHSELEIKKLFNEAKECGYQEKHEKAFKLMEEAFLKAITDNLVDLEIDALIGLVLLSSKKSNIGDRNHFIKKLEEIKSNIKDDQTLMMYHRAKSAFYIENEDIISAEQEIKKSIEIGSLPQNYEKSKELLCVVRSEYIHLLCNNNRVKEAKEQLILAENFSMQNPKVMHGEVYQATLNAGLHFSAKISDKTGALNRIKDLVSFADSVYLKIRVGNQLYDATNYLINLKQYEVALFSAESVLGLMNDFPEKEKDFLFPAVLYTIALTYFLQGKLEKAIEKIKPIHEICNTDNTKSLKFNVCLLYCDIAREIGDIKTSIEQGELAVKIAGNPKSVFMSKFSLAKSLSENGQIEDAMKYLLDAKIIALGIGIPKIILLEVCGLIADYSSQIGDDEVLRNIVIDLSNIKTDNKEENEVKKNYEQRIKANKEIRKRIFEISMFENVIQLKESQDNLKKSCFLKFTNENNSQIINFSSLNQVNALTVAPLLKWWDDYYDYDENNNLALDYDFWGRGCFAQILQNLQSFPNSFNISVEARTVGDIQNAVRIWSLYADFILIIWKGKTNSGKFLHLIDGEYFGPWGSGYITTLGSEFVTKKGSKRYPAFGYASWLPDEVMKLCIHELYPFIKSGKILLVPASGIGCISNGHGAIEQLISDVANCIPSIKANKSYNPPICLPYSQNIPLNALHDFINENEDDLLHMRKLFYDQSDYVKMNGLFSPEKKMELEISDTLKLIKSRNNQFTKKLNLNQNEKKMNIDISPIRIDGYNLINSKEQLYSPLLKIENLGYNWKVNSISSQPQYNYKVSKDEAIGSWLTPAECGIKMLFVKKVEN